MQWNWHIPSNALRLLPCSIIHSQNLAWFVLHLDLPTSRAQIFSRARSSSGRFLMFSAAKASKRARTLGPTTGTGNEKRRTSIKSMLHPVEEPSTECQSSDTVNSLLTETLKQTPRVSSCVCKSFFDGLKDGHFYKTDTHTETVVSVLMKGDCILLFCLFLLFFDFSATARERKSCHVQRNMKEGGRKIESMGREPKSWKQEWPKNR